MGLSPEFASMNEDLKAEGLRRVLRFGLLGLGAGAGTAGLIHLIKRLNKPKQPSYQLPVDIDMTVPTMKTSASNPLAIAGRNLTTLATKGAFRGMDDASTPFTGIVKGIAQEAPHVPLSLAGALAGSRLASHVPSGVNAAVAARLRSQPLSKLLALVGEIGGGSSGYFVSRQIGKALTKKSDWSHGLARGLMPTPAGESPPSILTPRWLRGDTQTSVTGMPWFWPALAGAGAAGVGGGSALVNWLMKKHRKNVLKKDLTKAEKEYEDAMLGQYVKKSSAEKTYTLDDVVDLMEKQGISLNDLLGKGTGAYLTGAGALAGVAGLGAYRWLKGRSQDQLLEKALKQRALIRALSHPPDIYVHPVAPKKHEHGTADELVTEAEKELL